MKTLPKDIEKLDKEMAAINSRLAEGNYYTRDPNGFAKDSKTLAELAAKKATAEEQWLELEMLREELEG